MPRSYKKLWLSIVVTVLVLIVGYQSTESFVAEVRHSNHFGYWSPDAFPINVIVDTESFTQPERETIFQAIEFWNRELGFRVFIPSEGDSSSLGFHTIFIEERELGNSSLFTDLLGEAHTSIPSWCHINGLRFDNVNIHIDDDNNESTLLLVTEHELGHALGLSHDLTDQDSIMYTYAAESSGLIQPEDREYIRSQTTSGFVPLFLLDNIL